MAEKSRWPDDRVMTGEMHQGIEENLAGMFLLWKGASMEDDSILPFVKNVGKDFVRLSANTSFYQNPLVAINHSFTLQGQDISPVIFVVACQNYESPFGLMFRNEAYSAYPSEREFLLIEGSNLWVLAINPTIIVENAVSELSKYNGKLITVIHLYLS